MKKLFDRAAIIFRLAAYDFKAAYAGSVFGSFWAVAEPLVTIAVYWFVYTVAFGGEDVYGVPYYLWLSVGMAAWFFVSNGLKAVTSVFRNYSYILKKMYFDKELLPIVRTFSQLWPHIIFVFVVLILSLFNGVFANLVQLLFAIVFALFFVYFAGRILALLCGKFKDIENIVSVILNIGFWLTPVFWNREIAAGKISDVIMYNPVAVIVELYRAAVFPECSVNKIWILYLIVVCVAFMLIGEFMKKRLLPDIADGF